MSETKYGTTCFSTEEKDQLLKFLRAGQTSIGLAITQGKPGHEAINQITDLLAVAGNIPDCDELQDNERSNRTRLDECQTDLQRVGFVLDPFAVESPIRRK